METDFELLTAINRKLSAIIALTVEQRMAADEQGSRKPELLLDSVGLTVDEIAKILGKNEPAVRKAIQRARNGGRRQPVEQGGPV